MWRVLIFIGLLIAGYFDTPPEFNGEPVRMGFWNFVIQGAAMGIGALLNRKKKKDAGQDVSNEDLSPEEAQAIQMLMQTGQLSMEQAQQLFGVSSEMIQGAQESFAGAQQDIGSARDYFNKLMSGDTAAQAEFFAPESQRIQQTYSQAAEQARRFGGAEGGESARLKSDLRAQ